MAGRKIIILIVLLTTILCGFSETTSYGNETIKEWTLMVYLAADNNLNNASYKDLEEMAAAGASENVNVVILDDHEFSGNSYYKVLEENSINTVMELGEVNMGDPNTLRDFVEWTTTNYPAQKYGIILWNHGGGFKELKFKDICWDETDSGDALTVPEIVEVGLENQYMDLIGFDACLMNQLEVAYGLKNSGGIMLGSEETIPEDGWPYKEILTYINNNPTVDARTLSEAIIDFYIESYASEQDITLSSIDLSKIDLVGQRVNTLANQLIDILPEDWDMVNEAVDDTQSYTDYTYKDLYHFTYLLDSYLSSDYPDISLATQELRDALDSAVIKSMYIGEYVDKSYGLTIWLPEGCDASEGDIYSRQVGDYVAYKSKYSTLSFAEETYWDDFLDAYMSEAIYDINDANLKAAIDDTFISMGMEPKAQVYCSDLVGWENFFADGYGIEDLSSMEIFTELYNLSLNYNQISDLEPISSLYSLRILWLSDNQIQNVDPLESLDSLQYLYLSNNYIENIRSLAELTNLKRLDIKGNPIDTSTGSLDSAVIKLMESRGTIVQYDKISSNEDFIDFNGKKDVGINKDFTIKFNMPVDLETADIGDFVTNSDGAYVSGVTIEEGSNDKEIVVRHPKTGYLRDSSYYLVINKNLKSTDGKSINNLLRMPFTTIKKGENETEIVFDDPNLEKAIKEELNIPLDVVIYDSDIENVTELDLEGKEISSIEGLQYFVNLTELILWDNNITDVSPLANLTNLELLDLDENLIEDVSPLANLTNLETLFIAENPIVDYSPLDNLINTDIVKKRRLKKKFEH